MATSEALLPAGSRRALLKGGAAGLVLAGGSLPLFAEAVESVTFDGLYKSFGVLGFEFSDRVQALKGQRIRITGFMAPPLKVESRFFVLTRQPLAICPFCQSDADWPVDIVAVFLKDMTPLFAEGRRVLTTGRLEIGSATDAETGFVSQIRLVEAECVRA